MSRVCRHTAEQDAAFSVAYTAGVPREQIISDINAMAGGNIETEAQFDWFARRLGCRRPAGWDKHTQKVAIVARSEKAAERRTSPPPPMLPIERTAPGSALPPVSRPWEVIQALGLRDAWAIVHRDDLVRWNRSRVRRGLVPFAISRGV